MIFVEKAIGTPTRGLILLAARGATPDVLMDMYSRSVDNVLIYSLAGPGGQWYPAPNGPDDQYEALRGLPKSVKLVKGYVKRMSREVPHDKIYLSGHSAGAVLALQVAAHSQEPLGGVHIHCGAILDPESLPKSNGTPIHVFHSQNDDIFSWDERFLPMKKALNKKGYNCQFIERQGHGHSLRKEDVKLACKEMKQ